VTSSVRSQGNIFIPSNLCRVTLLTQSYHFGVVTHLVRECRPWSSPNTRRWSLREQTPFIHAKTILQPSTLRPSAPFVRRCCECLASSAPFANIQTYLLTYLQLSAVTSWMRFCRSVSLWHLSVCLCVSVMWTRPKS